MMGLFSRKTSAEKLDLALADLLEHDPTYWYALDKTPNKVCVLSYQISRVLDTGGLELDLHCKVIR